MFWLLSCVVCYRVRQPIGEIFYIKKLESVSDVAEFTKAKGVNVVVFTNEPKTCSYMNFAISKYSTFEFAVAPESAGKEYLCGQFPCVVPFRDGKRVDNGCPPPASSTSFTFWCERLRNPSNVQIKHAEYLRIILETPGSAVIGVDVAKRPRKLEKDHVFYSVPKKVFADLGMKIEKGVYVYRNADRQLLPVKKDEFVALSETKVHNLDHTYLPEKKFVGGFVLGENETEGELEVGLMHQLADEFDKQFYFGIIPEEFVYEARLQFIPGPKFVVFPNIRFAPKNDKYLLREDCHKIEALRSFLKGIESNETEFTVVSEESPAEGYLSRRTFESMSTKADNLVVFADKKHSAMKHWLLCKKVQSVMNSSLLQVYWFNVTVNDLPPGMKVKTVPIVFMMNKKGEHKFDGAQYLFRDVFNFVLETAANRYDVPNVDPKGLEDEVRKEHTKALAEMGETDVVKRKTVLK